MNINATRLCIAFVFGVLQAFNVFAVTLNSQHAIVINDQTGAVMLSKNAESPVPIASLTKLMTAMVVLDSKPNMDERISIVEDDVDILKHSMSHVRVGTTLERSAVLRLALMSSDNRAAAALARTYPGGKIAFVQAVHAKVRALGMTQTNIDEPTGLSPGNMSTASDLAKMAAAAANYPEIRAITTNRSEQFRMNGRSVAFHNTNRLVGASGWDVLMSKTGFTNEAGHCLIMKIKQAGQSATLVLLNSKAVTSSVFDASKIRQLLNSPAEFSKRIR
jgi:D-alanyl-D-alanine carboxypeptidase/D-alanyl-D-alanine endopeptidase (penicillin-binding protein 7)